MRRLPPATTTATVARWLADNPHAYARSELLRVWSRWDVDTAARAGAIARVAPAVFAGAQHIHERLVRAEAVGLWTPGALVTGELALSIYSDELPAPAIADVVVAHGVHRRVPPGFRVMQRAPIAIRSAPSGVDCVLPERALLDAVHVAPASHLKSIFYEALWAKATTARAVARELARVPRVRGRRELERLLAHFEAGAKSPLEVFARTEVFVGKEWDVFRRQAALPVPGRRYEADMLHEATKVIVELDGRRYHGKRDRAERDRIRDAELAALGYVTVRLSPRDLADRPDWCRAVVRAAVAARTV